MTTLGIVTLLGVTATGIIPNGNFEKEVSGKSTFGSLLYNMKTFLLALAGLIGAYGCGYASL